MDSRRLNALTGVCLSRHSDETWIEVGRLELPCPDGWIDFRVGPKPEAASRREAKARKLVNEWIREHAYDGHRTADIVQRGFAPILSDRVVLPKFGEVASVVWRPWEKKPAGEVKVDAHPRIRFLRWKDFDAAILAADELTAPDLYKLGIAAGEIMSEGK